MISTRSTMELFTRDDGQALRVVAGFRERVLSAAQHSPRADWDDERYAAKARKKARQTRRFVEEAARIGGTVERARVLEVGCGAGIESILTAVGPVHSVVGIDVSLPLFDPGDKGERMRRLARESLAAIGAPADLDAVLQRPVRFETMDATRMAFPDNSFDLIRSWATMEHIVPPEPALAEMARVVRPGGLIYHGIDPFYWLKGCHKRGVVDIPWAHARLTPAEYHRFVAQHEGEDTARKRSRFLKTLNQFTSRQWRRTLESGPFEILTWTEERSSLAESVLGEYPEVTETLLDGVKEADLTSGPIRVWMRATKAGVVAERTDRL
jgi:ubiquinone/menaquinone biosynthesis C-methylase UbiE